MAIQNFAANGEKLSYSRAISSDLLEALDLNLFTPPKGLVGFNIESGLAEVILSPDTPMRTMRLGKFLKKSGLDVPAINKSGACAKKLKVLSSTELKFTNTREEVLHVYQNGPESCMKDVDAVQVYCTEDVAIAYLELDGKVVARSVVCKNPDIGLQYVRAYGLVDVLEEALEKAGYESGSLDSCRVLCLWNSDDDCTVMMPYVDGSMKADYPSTSDEFIELGTNGECECDSMEGILYRETCENCGDMGETTYCEHRDEDLCQHCYESEMVTVNDTQYHKDSDDIRELEDGTYVMADEACYVEERYEYHAQDDCVYNGYTDVYHLRSDLQI